MRAEFFTTKSSLYNPVLSRSVSTEIGRLFRISSGSRAASSLLNTNGFYLIEQKSSTESVFVSRTGFDPSASMSQMSFVPARLLIQQI